MNGIRINYIVFLCLLLSYIIHAQLNCSDCVYCNQCNTCDSLKCSQSISQVHVSVPNTQHYPGGQPYPVYVPLYLEKPYPLRVHQPVSELQMPVDDLYVDVQQSYVQKPVLVPRNYLPQWVPAKVTRRVSQSIPIPILQPSTATHIQRELPQSYLVYMPNPVHGQQNIYDDNQMPVDEYAAVPQQYVQEPVLLPWRHLPPWMPAMVRRRVPQPFTTSQNQREYLPKPYSFYVPSPVHVQQPYDNNEVPQKEYVQEPVLLPVAQ